MRWVQPDGVIVSSKAPKAGGASLGGSKNSGVPFRAEIPVTWQASTAILLVLISDLRQGDRS